MSRLNRAAIIAFAAIAMALSSCVLFHTDTRLNQLGVGSPLGLGDRLSGIVALWLQPWLIVAARSGLLQSWRLTMAEFLALGACSGLLLGAIFALAVWRWQRLFWPALIFLAVVAVATGAYAGRNFLLIDRIGSKPGPLGCPSMSRSGSPFHST